MIAFGRSVQSIPLLSDAEFLASIEWEESAPARLRRAAQTGALERLAEFVIELARGIRSRDAAAGASQGVRQWLWSTHNLEQSARAATLMRAWESFGTAGGGLRKGSPPADSRRTIAADLFSTLDRWTQLCVEDAPLSRLERLVLFELLRDAGGSLPSALAVKLWRVALTDAIKRTDVEGGKNTVPEAAMGGPKSDFPGSRLIEVELDWQAGLLFAPVSGAGQLAAAARNELGRSLFESTDSAGVPAAEIVDDLPNWLATLVRGREWGRRFGRPLFERPQEKRFRALVGAVSRLCRGDGRSAFSTGQANGVCGMWSAAAASVSHRRGVSSPALQYLRSLGAKRAHRPRPGASRNGRSKGAANGAARRKQVRPVFQSDTSRLACLRSDWAADANVLSVSHHRHFPVLEFSARGTPLFRGDWAIAVRVGAEELAVDGPWICSCWYSNDEGDYLELQTQLTAEIRIERQLLLARNDDVLLLADAVINCGEARIDYVSRLPLVPGVKAFPAEPTRECRLVSPAGPARLFPLGLPCERVIGSAGQLAESQDHLELRQSGIGGLYAPVVIDWNAARRRSPAIWRPLTVAQNGAAVPSGLAAGCRLQIGAAQWLVYRSLSPILEPRTVLGQHTMYETMIGRFAQSGEVEPMVLVEQRTEKAP